MFLQDANGRLLFCHNLNGFASIITEPIQYHLAKGNWPEATNVFVRGRSEATTTAWTTLGQSNTLIECLDSAMILNVVSTSINDTLAGSGARTVYIAGLDANYNEQSEILTLNGTTPVNTINDYVWAHTLMVLTAGSTGYNEGILTLNDTITLMTMPIQFNNAYNAAYMVPAGYTFYLERIFLGESSNKSTEFGVWLKLDGGLWTNLVTERLINGTENRLSFAPSVVPEKAQIQLRVKSDQAGAKASGSIIGWTELNN